MRAVIQKVERAKVTVDGEVIGEIGPGLLVFLAVSVDDTQADQEYMVKKIANLRIFPDEQGKMNLSIQDVKQEILLISQFTLLGDCRKGMRPSFTQAAPPEKAKEIYLKVIKDLQNLKIKVEKGMFQAHMKVELINDGPVTVILDSKRIF
ncbi:MAG TPA: D-tyrosyl-tRNA(Tyr) deacylase [Clostridia bacterium]|jgi:D-tyrosyl-tRNA(Tyr) deacylase|nr:D-tyrosyl-tRNA(Tyr) deacylase [Clostridia bacterium]